MKSWPLLGILSVALSLSMLCSCGGTADDVEIARNVPFTPPPRPTPVPKLCGNGTIDAGVGEQCEADRDCGGGASCVCCVCLQAGEALGERVFSVARPPSLFLTTGLGGADVSRGVWLPGPLRLAAGRPDADLPEEEACSASVALVEDTIVGWGVIDGSTVCVKIFAEGSAGTIDCDGGTAHDVEYRQNSNGREEEDEPVITTGLGDPIGAGPGAASFTVNRAVVVNLPVGFSPATCLTEVDYDDPLSPEQVAKFRLDPPDVVITPLAFTTNTGTGVVENPLAGTAVLPRPISLGAEGQNFACGTWSEEDSPGLIVAPLGGLDTIIGDTVNMMVLADRPTTP